MALGTYTLTFWVVNHVIRYRSALFLVIMQLTTTHCVITQKRSVLSYFKSRSLKSCM